MESENPPKEFLPEPELLNARQAAAMLGISERSFNRRFDEGKTPPKLKLGGCARWRAQELRDYIRAGCPHRRDWTWPTQS